jgi:PilZ domain
MSETMTPHQKDREFRRIPIGYQVKLVSDDRIIAYPRAINLSMGGILLSGPAHLPVGSHCGVAILLANSDAGRRVVARGTVVRTDEVGMAISFSKALDPESENALRWLIQSLAPGAEEAVTPRRSRTVAIPDLMQSKEAALEVAGSARQIAKEPEAGLANLMDRLKPGSARHVKGVEAWEPPDFKGYEDIREWLKESVMSATMYERFPDGRWTIQLLLKEQNPGTYRYIVL